MLGGWGGLGWSLNLQPQACTSNRVAVHLLELQPNATGASLASDTLAILNIFVLRKKIFQDIPLFIPNNSRKRDPARAASTATFFNDVCANILTSIGVVVVVVADSLWVVIYRRPVMTLPRQSRKISREFLPVLNLCIPSIYQADLMLFCCYRLLTTTLSRVPLIKKH